MPPCYDSPIRCLPTPLFACCSKLWEELADVAHDNQDW